MERIQRDKFQRSEVGHLAGPGGMYVNMVLYMYTYIHIMYVYIYIYVYVYVYTYMYTGTLIDGWMDG